MFQLPACRTEKPNKVCHVRVAVFFGERRHGGRNFAGPVWPDGILIPKKHSRMRTFFRTPPAQQIGYGRQIVRNEDAIFVPARREDLVVLSAEKCAVAPVRNMLGLDLGSDFAQRANGCPGDMNVKEQFHQPPLFPSALAMAVGCRMSACRGISRFNPMAICLGVRFVGFDFFRKCPGVGERLTDAFGGQCVFPSKRFNTHLSRNHFGNPIDSQPRSDNISHAPRGGFAQVNLREIPPAQTFLNQPRAQLRRLVTKARGKAVHPAFNVLWQPQCHNRCFTHTKTFAHPIVRIQQKASFETFVTHK